MGPRQESVSPAIAVKIVFGDDVVVLQVRSGGESATFVTAYVASIETPPQDQEQPEVVETG